mgnify:CR=1 FL=1
MRFFIEQGSLLYSDCSWFCKGVIQWLPPFVFLKDIFILDWNEIIEWIVEEWGWNYVVWHVSTWDDKTFQTGFTVKGKPKIIVQQLSDIWQDIKEPRNLKLG